ncbi:hypothetical protein H9Q13_14360 [Pontibacter sp. JH31]|uniref:Uncharacterized protein n=1 Tax=Pontibacter aquaedesilientis TaxID=2766980 RepID=A0ABR7XLP6_9BACT|nr:hypothetical protein [Pontibacter aquaedesilientis]MBD1398351.1 hypothetical protein [Pontibacter aquaedesilientis]
MILQHQAAYYYMSANAERPAEIIEILNSDRPYVQVPMREEDVMLEAFFVRDMSAEEIQSHGNNQVWQIFGTWGELIDDHLKLHVNDYVLAELFHYKNQYPLPEGMAA